MHYHLEILMPPTPDVDAAVKTILARFDENAEEPSRAFWDWWQLGGRYAGSKLEALVTEERRAAFLKEIHRLGVTVSGLQWGKQELSPASQIGAVDSLWREMCPEGGSVCPLFKHSGDEMNMDVCRLAELPARLTAYSFIAAAPDYEGQVAAETLLHKSIWNGCTRQDTSWDGNVAGAVVEYAKRVDGYREDYREPRRPKPDWLVVTVDYHS